MPQEETVTLLPDTKRLKQLIKAHGNRWLVVRREKSVACFNGRPGLMIATDITDEPQHLRWVEPHQIKRADRVPKLGFARSDEPFENRD